MRRKKKMLRVPEKRKRKKDPRVLKVKKRRKRENHQRN